MNKRKQLIEYHTFGLCEETVPYNSQHSITLEDFWKSVKNEKLNDLVNDIYIDKYDISNEYSLYINTYEDHYRVITTDAEHVFHGDGIRFSQMGLALNYALAILRKAKLNKSNASAKTKWLCISIGCIVLSFVSMICTTITNNIIMTWLMILSFIAFWAFLIVYFVYKKKQENAQKKERELQNTPYARLKRYYEDCIMILENYYQGSFITDRFDYVAFVKEDKKWKIAYEVTTFHPGYRPDGGGCDFEIPEHLINKHDPKSIATFITEKTGLKCDLSSHKSVIYFCDSYPFKQ